MKKMVSIILIIAMVFSVSVQAVLANESIGDTMTIAEAYGLSHDVVTFLNEHNVELSDFDEIVAVTASEGSVDRIEEINGGIESLVNSAKAYGFTDEQIQSYVDGLIDTPATVVGESDVMVASIPNSQNRPTDEGIGWEVRSKPLYCQTTAFATLPTVTNKTYATTPYMFFSVETDDSWNMDVGIGYEYGGDTGTILEWRGFYTADGNTVYDVERRIVESSYVYFDASIQSDGFLRLRVLDGNDFSKVFYDVVYYVAGHGLTRTNTSFNRQITLCDKNKQYNCGTKISNASFTDAYLYSANGEWGSVSNSNCDTTRCGRFGVDNTTRSQVTATYQEWDQETVSISF